MNQGLFKVALSVVRKKVTESLYPLALIAVFSLAIYGLSSVGLNWLGKPTTPPEKTFPVWEQPYYLWESDWEKILTSNVSSKTNVDGCTETSNYLKWGWVPIKTYLCQIMTEDLWRRTVFGIEVSTVVWKQGTDRDSWYLFSFPYGPFSIYDPSTFSIDKPRRIEKQIISLEEIGSRFIQMMTSRDIELYSELITDLNIDLNLDLSKERKIRKWRSPVYFVIEDYLNEPDAIFIQKILTGFKKITNLSGVWSEQVSRDDPRMNARVVILKEEQRQSVFDVISATIKINPSLNENKYHDFELFGKLRNSCQATVMYHNDDTAAGIIGATIYIVLQPTNKDDFYKKRKGEYSCYEEELGHLFGMGGDIRELEPTVYNDASPYEELTELDKAFLEMLYDSRIMSGMGREELTPIVTEIIEEWVLKAKYDRLVREVCVVDSDYFPCFSAEELEKNIESSRLSRQKVYEIEFDFLMKRQRRSLTFMGEGECIPVSEKHHRFYKDRLCLSDETGKVGVEGPCVSAVRWYKAPFIKGEFGKHIINTFCDSLPVYRNKQELFLRVY